MITKILIKNFQSHKRTIIDLSNGINIFVGISDKGKTVIIRAINWVIYNKPSGDAFRSYWGGDTIVELTFSDGTVVTRGKTNSENYYKLNGERLKAFGQGVPEEVTKAINMDMVNIQLQMDAPFLLSETAGEVASHFNKIAGISIIDKSIAKAKKEVADTKSSINQRKEDLEEKIEQLKQYALLDSLEEKVKRLDRKDKRKNELSSEVTLLKNKIARLDEIYQEIDEILEKEELEVFIKNIRVKETEMNTIKSEVEQLTTLLDKLKYLEIEIEATNILIVLEPDVLAILNKQKQLGQFQRDLKPLKQLIGKYTTLTNEAAKNEEKLAELVEGLPDVCPVCKGTGKLK